MADKSKIKVGQKYDLDGITVAVAFILDDKIIVKQLDSEQALALPPATETTETMIIQAVTCEQLKPRTIKYLVEQEFYGGPLNGQIQKSWRDGKEGDIHSVEPDDFLYEETYMLCGAFTLPHEEGEKCRFRYRFRNVQISPETFAKIIP